MDRKLLHNTLSKKTFREGHTAHNEDAADAAAAGGELGKPYSVFRGRTSLGNSYPGNARGFRCGIL